MFSFITANWEWCLLALYVLEKYMNIKMLNKILFVY